MKVTRGREKENKFNGLKDVLKQFKRFDSRLQIQILQAEEANENLTRAIENAEKTDPTGEWELTR